MMLMIGETIPKMFSFRVISGWKNLRECGGTSTWTPSPEIVSAYLVLSGHLPEPPPPDLRVILQFLAQCKFMRRGNLKPHVPRRIWITHSAIKDIKKHDQGSCSYPRTNLMISPGWRISPTSSQTDTVIEPVLSATRHARTTWESFVLVAFPTRNSGEFQREFSVWSNREQPRG